MSAILFGILPEVQAGEAWQPVFEDGLIIVAIDTASIRREKQIAVFRERQVLRRPEVDPESMRHIHEVQYRRQADCSGRTLSELSRAVFSVQGTLVRYEANSPTSARWEPPQSDKDFRLIEAVCGQA